MPITRKPSCPSGYILRDAYKTASGKCTQSRCIRKTGLLKGKSSVRASKHFSKAKSNSIKARSMSLKKGVHVDTKCDKHYILRRGYTRRSYDRRTGKKTQKQTHYRHALIAPGCIVKRGKSKRIHGEPSTRIFIDEDDHFLSDYGYHNVEDKTKAERHQSLHKLIKHFIPIKGEMSTYNYVIKALNARYIVNKNTNPKVARIFKADQRAISKEYKSRI